MLLKPLVFRVKGEIRIIQPVFHKFPEPDGFHIKHNLAAQVSGHGSGAEIHTQVGEAFRQKVMGFAKVAEPFHNPFRVPIFIFYIHGFQTRGLFSVHRFRLFGYDAHERPSRVFPFPVLFPFLFRLFPIFFIFHFPVLSFSANNDSLQ